MLVTVPVILNYIGIHNLHQGLVDVATNPSNVNYNPDALNMGSSAGLRYGMVAAVVAMGQVRFDLGYFS